MMVIMAEKISDVKMNNAFERDLILEKIKSTPNPPL